MSGARDPAGKREPWTGGGALGHEDVRTSFLLDLLIRTRENSFRTWDGRARSIIHSLTDVY